MCAAGNATCVKSIESELLCAYIGLTEVTEALIKEGVYMKQKMKRLTALGISAAMLVSPAACSTPKDAANEVASEELGSGIRSGPRKRLPTAGSGLRMKAEPL